MSRGPIAPHSHGVFADDDPYFTVGD